VRLYAARHRARGIYDGHCHPFRLLGVKGWRRRLTARRRCDRPVGAGRSTALRAVLAPQQPGPGRQIVIKTGKAVSRFSSQAGTQSEADSPTPASRNVADCHRSPFSPPLPAIGGPDQPPSTYSLRALKTFQPAGSGLGLCGGYRVAAYRAAGVPGGLCTPGTASGFSTHTSPSRPSGSRKKTLSTGPKSVTK
jgi:hypothetical protein